MPSPSYPYASQQQPQQHLPAAQPLTASAVHARVSPTGLVQFVLDPDIRLACEDQAQAQGLPFGEWLQATLNDALRGYFGI